MRHIGEAGAVRLAFAAVAIACCFCLLSPAGAAAHSPRIRVSNPPPLVRGGFSLEVHGAKGVVSVLASVDRHPGKGDVVLSKKARIHGSRLKVHLPKKLAPGAWFVLVCTAPPHRSCGASKHATVIAPKRLSSPAGASPVLEAGRAASATIGTAGGKVEATAANGTKFVLEIAAGSVQEGTTITMTPLASLGGAKWAGKFVGGVQLGPEGLLLVHGGTLTVIPKRHLAVKGQVAIGYTGGGERLREVSFAPTRKAIEIPLAHFSGVGVGDGGGSPPAGSTNVDFYGQMTAGETQDWREGKIGESEWKEVAASILQDMYEAIMREEVPPGLAEDQPAEQAMRDLLAYAREYQLVTSQDALPKVTPTLLELLHGIYNRAQKRCAEQHDLTQIKRILEVNRQEILLGGQERLEEDVKCATFRVDFDSLIQVHAGEGGSGEWQFEYAAHPTVKLDPASGFQVLKGSTNGEYAKATGTIVGEEGETDTVVGGTPARFEVANLGLSLTPSSSPIPLVLNIGVPTESHHVVGSEGSFDYQESLWWALFWGPFHGESLQGGMLSLPLEPGSGELVARGTWNQTLPEGVATEKTTIDVFHTPPG